MSTQVASLYADIGAKTDGFTKGAATVKSGLAGLSAEFITNAAVITAFSTALNFSIQEAGQAEKVDAQLGAVLASTGGAAGMARDELDQLATSLSRVSTFDDEAIKSSEALLLTFTKVGSEVFPQAEQAILDMATALGTDLQGATLQVGKALNDPIKGITALSRAGVSFSEEQKDLIKTLVESGDTMGAQKIILEELSKEFSGSATAAANTYEGQVKQLQNEVGNLAEVFGSKLIPVLADVAGGMTDFLRIQEDANQLMESGENTYRRAAIAQATIEEVTKRNSKETDSASRSYTDMAKAIGDSTGSIDELVPSIEEAEAAMKLMTETNNDMLSLTRSISDENRNYSESLIEEQDTLAELQGEIDNLIAQGYSPQGEAVQEVTDKYNDQAEKVQELKDKHADALAGIATDLMIAKLQADGFTDAEYNMAIAMLESTGQIDGAAAQTALAMDKIATAAQNAGEGGAVAFGEIMKTVMADGVISNEELQSAMDKFNTEIPKEEVSGFNEEIGVAKDEGIANMDELQSSVDSFSTEAAVAEVQELIDAINSIPDIPTTTPTALPPTIATQGRNAGIGAGSTIQNIYITSATFVGDGGQWAQI